MPEVDPGPTGEEIYLALEKLPPHACALICLSKNAYVAVWRHLRSGLPPAVGLVGIPHEFTVNGCKVRDGIGTE